MNMIEKIKCYFGYHKFKINFDKSNIDFHGNIVPLDEQSGFGNRVSVFPGVNVYYNWEKCLCCGKEDYLGGDLCAF